MEKPIEFLFFKGMDDNNITDVVSLEVKTGKSPLTSIERKLARVYCVAA